MDHGCQIKGIQTQIVSTCLEAHGLGLVKEISAGRRVRGVLGNSPLSFPVRQVAKISQVLKPVDRTKKILFSQEGPGLRA